MRRKLIPVWGEGGGEGSRFLGICKLEERVRI